MRRVPEGQILTAKLKLHLTPEQKREMDAFTVAYRDGLNYVSKVVFDMKKTGNVNRVHRQTYEELRSRFKLPSQVCCSIERQVCSTINGLWTKVKKNAKHLKMGYTKRRYKGLDKAPKFVSRTASLQYGRDFGFKDDNIVSVQSMNGRIKTRYTGYSKHLDMIRNGARIGGAKIFYDKPSKQYFLLVSIEVPLVEVDMNKCAKVKGVDVGQRNLAVTQDNNGNVEFFKGKETIHKANKITNKRKELRKKGTRSATKKVVAMSKRERRLKAQINHNISKKIVESNSIIGIEDLTDIRERTQGKRRKKNASDKQKKANANNSKWAFAELHSFIAYKANLAGSLCVKVDADYTSQACIKCGHTSKENRPSGSVIFKCKCCGYEAHSDLVGGRNILMRTISQRQRLLETGCFVKKPIVSDVDPKKERLKRYSTLRWSQDASQRDLSVGA